MSEKLTQRTELSTAPDALDLFHVVDVSDITDSPEGTSKKILYSNLIPDASTTVEGKVELATDAETITGTDTVRAMTPSNLTAKIDTDGTLAGNLDTRIPSQKAVKTYVATNGFNGANFFAPRGFLLNGKFVVTYTGSGINIAIKTSSGTDPTSTDVVYIRIGDKVRSITSALSRTILDGTSYGNAGSSELANKEIDWFLYTVWDSNSSSVNISPSRIPYGNLVSDFSATTTNEKHLIGYADYTPTDEVEVIGRFAATLSAGAGYTWSVPTFTAANLIQRPIYETRQLYWSPVITVSGGTVPTFTNHDSNKYKLIGKRCFFEQSWDNAAGGTAGAGANPLLYTLPFSSGNYSTSNRYTAGHGTIFATASSLADCLLKSANQINIWMGGSGVATGASFAATVRAWWCNGNFEI